VSVWVISCGEVVGGPSVPTHLCSPVTCRNLGKPAPILKRMNPYRLATCACFMIVVMGYTQTVPRVLFNDAVKKKSLENGPILENKVNCPAYFSSCVNVLNNFAQIYLT
jgi:hypothetical protein